MRLFPVHPDKLENLSGSPTVNVESSFLGVEFLFGTNIIERSFGPQSPFVNNFRNGYLGEVVRRRIALQGRAYCSSKPRPSLPIYLPLGELRQIPMYVYPFAFGFQMMSHTQADTAYVGSFSGGSITITGVDCTRCYAVAKIDAFNVSGLASSTRLPPPLGYGAGRSLIEEIRYRMPVAFVVGPFAAFANMQFSSILPNNLFGAKNALGNSIRQNFSWTEKVPLRTSADPVNPFWPRGPKPIPLSP